MGITINDFVRYRKLNAKLKRLRRQIVNLEEMQGRYVADKVVGSDVEHPYMERHYTEVGLLHNKAEIEARKDELKELSAEAEGLLKRLAAFLKTVEDREICDALRLYYIDGVTYPEVAEGLGLQGDGSPILQRVRRYMRQFLEMHVNHGFENDIV